METTIGLLEHRFEEGVRRENASLLRRSAVSAAAQRWRSILRAGSAQARGSVPPLLLDECTVWAVGCSGASKNTRLGFLQRFTRRSPDSCLSASCAKDVAPTLRCGDYGTASEQSRIQAHIARAEKLAARRDLSALSAEQKLVRALLLECLREYRAAGIFPDNRDFAEATPYFIDSRGVRCAMAHLLEVGGEFELVQKIARERNNATIAELADEPRLLAWLDAAGITVEEAAAIQPAYCEPISDCFCTFGLFGPSIYPAIPRVSLPVVSAVVRGEIVVIGASEQTVVVREIFGSCGPLRPGDTVITALSRDGTTLEQHRVGQRVLVGVALDAEGNIQSRLWAVGEEADGTVRCDRTGLSATVPQLTAATLAGAVRCQSVLEALDPRWARRYGPTCEAGVDGGDATAVSDGGDGWVVGDVPDPSRCMVGPRPDVVLMDAAWPDDASNPHDGAGAFDAPTTQVAMDAVSASDSALSGDGATMQMPSANGCACSAIPVAGPPISSIAVLTAVLSALSMRARMRARVRALR